MSRVPIWIISLSLRSKAIFLYLEASEQLKFSTKQDDYLERSISVFLRI